MYMFNNRVANVNDDDSDILDITISELNNTINYDYDYVQSYIYLFFFICLITGIIIFH